MSIELIQQYHAKVAKLIQYGGSKNESSVRKAFQELLYDYAWSKDLLLVPEVEYATAAGHKVYPDGTLKDALRQDWGYWESKDEKDDLEAEIKAKFADHKEEVIELLRRVCTVSVQSMQIIGEMPEA